jgi:galactokinase
MLCTVARMGVRERVAEAFRDKFGRPCMGIARAPGRVNLLGEHVDYNDGFVLPAAIDRATYVAFAPAHSEATSLWALDFDEQSRFTAQGWRTKRAADGQPLATWARYPAGVAWVLDDRGYEIQALDALFASDVPRGAGLSSSASVELAFGAAWRATGGWSMGPMELALNCQRAENEYVGVNCGIMDQATSACGEEGRMLHLDCRSLHYQTLPLPPGVVIIVADTGVRHSLTASAYNSRRAACEEAVRLLKVHLPEIEALRDVDVPAFDRLAHELPREVALRARHVVEEIERTRRAAPLLGSGDVEGFGLLMNACHASLRDLYGVSCPELDIMVRIAQSLPGCYGARLTGAGFGGCTVNLVEGDRAVEFVQQLGAAYLAETGNHSEIYVCTPSGGANIL